jgi:deoxyadenosine/deoxycytidine kinase
LLGAVVFCDPFERNPFLTRRGNIEAEFRGEVPLATEMTFLALRIAQLRRIGATLQAGINVITDWALVKTRVFPRMALAPDDADCVEAACGLWQPGLCVPDLLIHLRAGPAVLAARIAGRGPTFEQHIGTAELAHLNAQFDVVPDGLPVLPVDASSFNVFDDTAVTTLAGQITALIARYGRTTNP